MIRTARLILRQWRIQDLDPFAAMNADPGVRACFPSLLDRAACDEAVIRHSRALAERGYGLWAVEQADDGGFLGLAGVREVTDDLADIAGVELAWSLRREAWGKGFATEAARAAVGFARGYLPEQPIVAFTAALNARSVAVMRRLGMEFVRRFDHPRVAEGHQLRPHVLYRLPAPG